MQDKDLFDGVVGKYSDCMDENVANEIRKNDDCKIASNSSAPTRPRKYKNMEYGRNFYAFFFFSLCVRFTSSWSEYHVYGIPYFHQIRHGICCVDVVVAK